MFDIIRMGASGAASDYEIERSLRFNDGDSPELSRTPGSAGNRRTYTISVWVKIGLNSNYRAIIGAGGGSTRDRLQIFNDDKLVFNLNDGTDAYLRTTRLFRDPSAWYHIVVGVDTTQVTASNRIKLYVNGVQETSFTNETYPSQNYDCRLNNNIETFIGQSSSDNLYFDGYIADFNFIDGTQLTPSSFGETNADTEQWIPKKYAGTYGSNGYHLNFANNDLLTNFVDSSSSARTITRVGNVTHSSTQKKIGATSIYFDGTGDCIHVPDHSDFTFGTGDFTIEAWFRRSRVDADEWFLIQGDGTSAGSAAGLHIWSTAYGGSNANKAHFRLRIGGSNVDVNGTTTLAVNTWYHMAGVRDGNTARIYINGVQEASVSISGSLNDSSAPFVLGAVMSNGDSGIQGYLDNVRVSNNCRYPDGTSFTPSTSHYTSDGNTLWLVKSQDKFHLGTDSSSNGNDFTPTNLAATDAVKDSPTNNFCTLNVNDNNLADASPHFVYSEGNLKAAWSFTGENYDRAYGTLFVEGSDTNKYYWEATGTQNNEQMRWGVEGTHVSTYQTNNRDGNAGAGTDTAVMMWQPYGTAPYLTKIDANEAGVVLSTSNGNAANGDIFSFVFDGGTGKFYVWFKGVEISGQDYAAGTSVFDAVDSTKTYALLNAQGDGGVSTKNGNFILNWGQDSSFAGSKTAQGNTDANGIGDFYYSVPSGAKALCTANLPDPTIKLPNKHFEARAYTGTGAGNTQTLTGFEFAPNLVWIKNRTSAYNHALYDTVRGASNRLYPNLKNAEASNAALSAFTSDGYTVGTDAANENNQSSWNWNETATAGFDIVSYTGNGSAGNTFSHSLGVAPDLVIIKNRDSGTPHWFVYMRSMGNTTWIPLETNSTANGSVTDTLNSTSPTSSVVTLGNNSKVNASGDDYIAYLWSAVSGYSKFWYYKGNGNANGPFVYTGFKPAFMIAKNTATTNYWRMWDHKVQPTNPVATGFYPNVANAEDAPVNWTLDFLSNGFKVRNDDGEMNGSGQDIIYWAWAESPFKYSTAR